jgi:hypothetical protein
LHSAEVVTRLLFMAQKPKKEETAIARRLRELGLSVEKGRDYLKEREVEISSNYLGSIARGQREPALPLARQIAKALDLDLIDVVGE